VEVYTPKRKAEFLLSNAVDAADYIWARQQVKAMGINLDQILHIPPAKSEKP
jgi:hypothetical protein